jgi:ribosome-binding protein aMBF1 (putative translation factor)
MDYELIILNELKKSPSPLTPKRLAKKLNIKKCVINAVLHHNAKIDMNLKKQLITPFNRLKKRPIWYYISDPLSK